MNTLTKRFQVLLTLRRFYKVDVLYEEPSRQATKKMSPKHWNPRYKSLRAKKFKYVALLDADAIRNDTKMTPEEIRAKMKKEGILPQKPYMEKPFHISSSSGILEPFVPPEGEGYSVPFKERAKDQTKEIILKGRSMLDLRQIKKMDPEFDIKAFPAQAQDIYIKAHEALKTFDQKLLHQYVTEKAYLDMTLGLEYSTVDWEFVESLEAPRVVHARVFKMLGKTVDFGQITVRFHTKQRLAIYDRFGRLAYGASPQTAAGYNIPRDVLEYVVFENHLVDRYGIWRLHGKIAPDWAAQKNPNQVMRTFRLDHFEQKKEENVGYNVTQSVVTNESKGSSHEEILPNPSSPNIKSLPV